MIREIRSPDAPPRPPVVMEVITDPEYNARADAQMARYTRNSDWLADHWPELLPQARGKYVAVADQQAYIADTSADAWAWCDREHPGDDGPLVQYVHEHPGPKIYAIRG